MQAARRITLVPPAEDQTGGSIEVPESGSLSIDVDKTDKIKNKIYDKMHRLIKVIIKLAKYDSFDDNYRIKTKNGYLDKTNVIELLTHAMAIGKVLHGEDEFIALLADRQVDPELLLNENVKAKLIKYKSMFHSDGMPNLVKETPLRQTPLDPIRDEPRAVNKGNKKFIVVNNDEDMELALPPPRAFKRKLMVENNEGNKRKRTEDDDNSLDDDGIDQTQWQI